MYEWFDCRVTVISREYFPAARPRTTLAFLHIETVDQNASLEAELLDLTSIP